MTTRTAEPETSPARAQHRAGQSPWLIGVLEAVQAAAIIAFLALVGGIASYFLLGGEGNAAGGVLRAAAAAWALAFALPVSFLSGVFALPPLLLSLVPALVLARAGRRTAEALTVARLRGDESRLSTSAAVAGLVVVPSAVSVGALALAHGLAGWPAAELARAVVLIVVSVLAGLWSYSPGEGASPAARSAAWWRDRAGVLADVPVGGVLAVAWRALGGLLAIGLAALGLAIVLGFGPVDEVSRAYSGGAAGQIGVVIVQLSFLPIAAIWALAWASGAGFAVGVETLYSPLAVSTGPLPAIPAFAAIPGRSLPFGLAAAALIVACGYFAGRALLRRNSLEIRPPAAELRAGAALLVVVGLASWWLTLLGSGAIGPGRLAESGPVWWFPLVLSAEFGAGIGLALLHRAGAFNDLGRVPNRVGDAFRSRIGSSASDADDEDQGRSTRS